MGVPELWPFLEKEICRNYHGGTKNIQYIRDFKDAKIAHDYLHLDSNGCLHEAAQIVFNYGEHKRMLASSFTSLTEEEKINKVAKIFIEDIINVTKFSKLKHGGVLFLALDGTAPVAKQNQQRARRYVAAESKPESFDPNCITPGTKFMKKIEENISQSLRKIPFFSRFKVKFSGVNEPGEGEHKIMDYVRSLPEEEREYKKHAMFGPDGDLIILTMTSPVTYMNLLRKDVNRPECFVLVFMKSVKEDISKMMNQYHKIKKGERLLSDCIGDFTLISFLIGNDFLPKIKMFDKLSLAVKTMITLYKEISDKGIYLVKEGEINIKGFYMFIKALNKIEYEFILNQFGKKVYNPLTVDKTLQKYVNSEYDEEVNDKVNVLDYEGYRKIYYEKSNIIIEDDEDEKEDYEESGLYQINSMAKDYIFNLVWVFLYYTKTLPSWTFHYDYHYAPLMSDFKDFTKRLNDHFKKNSDEKFLESIGFVLGKPLTPEQQLLCVLPPKSSKLIPKKYRGLIENKDSPLVKLGFYPRKFKVDYEGKYKLYQGVVLVDHIDHEVVVKEMEKCK